MIDRDIRRRLLSIMVILNRKQVEMTVKQVIFELKIMYSGQYQVERRAVYADLKALEDFGQVTIRTGAANTIYAKSTALRDMAEVV
jgi:predicted DNA-binding transcriptional regulator YafY